MPEPRNYDYYKRLIAERDHTWKNDILYSLRDDYENGLVGPNEYGMLLERLEDKYGDDEWSPYEESDAVYKNPLDQSNALLGGK